ncbi:MAG: HipA domain-containing protein [Bacteroidota bacterium]
MWLPIKQISSFIQFSGNRVKQDLHQLWRRIIFNIAVSNTDDHLRNHGFLFTQNGWQLSPAYDLNPSIEKDGLSLNIDMENNALDFELAKSVGEYFQLTNQEMNTILCEVKESVKTWQTLAKALKIARRECEMMSLAFQY